MKKVSIADQAVEGFRPDRYAQLLGLYGVRNESTAFRARR